MSNHRDKQEYLLLRLARHFMPAWISRFLLQHGWFIRPGLETADPRAAVERYRVALEKQGFALAEKRILVFGYGGHFGVGVELLRLGAVHVVLRDRYATLDHRRNLDLLPEYGDYLARSQGEVLPRPEFITLLHDDIRQAAKVTRRGIQPVDIVLSTSVYEHLPGEEIDGITAALAALTKSDGIHLHIIDLRDHFFKYPFEMLTFPDRVWRNWLNPTSNLNRYRLQDYRRVFEQHFQYVEIRVMERDVAAFERARPRIRLEFLSGDANADAATLIRLFARPPHYAPGQ